jgi:anion-transporting  ArsA/GET3 family ATPase
MNLRNGGHSLVVVVGAGGVGKTTLAASLGLMSARYGRNTLVMTFDPSARLKDTLGVGEHARDREVPVAAGGGAQLAASLLDARQTFDRLVRRYAPDEQAAERILSNRFYGHLAGNLAGILEYMAVERLFEVAGEGRYDRVILDTPPTRQALDFLGAPARIVGFLDSGALRLGLRPWFDDKGRLKPTVHLGMLGRSVEGFLDRMVGMDLLREMAEFFQAFGPLYAGFRERAERVQALLKSPDTTFVLVTGPGEERVPETAFFARHLVEGGYHLGPLIINMVHPRASSDLLVRPDLGAGARLLSWLGERDHRGIAAFQRLVQRGQTLADVPLLAQEPTDLRSLEALGRMVVDQMDRPLETSRAEMWNVRPQSVDRSP